MDDIPLPRDLTIPAITIRLCQSAEGNVADSMRIDQRLCSLECHLDDRRSLGSMSNSSNDSNSDDTADTESAPRLFYTDGARTLNYSDDTNQRSRPDSTRPSGSSLYPRGSRDSRQRQYGNRQFNNRGRQPVTPPTATFPWPSD